MDGFFQLATFGNWKKVRASGYTRFQLGNNTLGLIICFNVKLMKILRRYPNSPNTKIRKTKIPTVKKSHSKITQRVASTKNVYFWCGGTQSEKQILLS